ncbi:guanine nucleotide-binding protein-like 3 [Anguilla anguilla]|uniref:guanine nucleotide-binding protein-like 3 n=1 Tax=Anguilla anguilla TaxID=7936 RepID=UPI0015AF03DF|nr:guanine nucleotide-binding protein-like 3 [Anguilla anguilla]
MKRPKLKKASKRMSCSKRYKIQKKVREHNRKLRKEAKKKGITKRVKKDPGVPSIAPFKEEVLREAEQRKLKLEELKQKKRLEKQQERERAQKRKREATSSDSNTQAKKVKKEGNLNRPQKSSGKDKYSRKFLCDELNKVISDSSVIVEVLDARDPLGCRCPELEEAVLKSEGNKKLLLVLNKIDLVPKSNAEKWLRYLQHEFPTVAFKASVYLQDKTVQEKKKRAGQGAVDQSKGTESFGSSCLLQFLQDYAEAQEGEKTLKVGIVGFPNVGKSSLINSLKGVRACNAGAQGGLTKCTQEVLVAKNVKMIDSPSIMAAPSNPAFAMALRSLPTPGEGGNALDAVRALLKHCDKQQIMLQYTVPDFRNSLEFLTCLAKKRGLMQKGGVPNTAQAAETFLSDWTGTKLSYHSKPPDNPNVPSYLSDETVTEMKKGWDLNKLQKGNSDTIKSVKLHRYSTAIILSSMGPTSGLLSVSEGLETKELGDEEECQEEAIDNEPDLVHAEGRQLEQSQNGKEPQETTPGFAEHPTKVKFQPKPITIDLSSAQKDDDAYDFNTDFK